jgi:glucokinase
VTGYQSKETIKVPFYVGIDVGGTTSTVAIGAHNHKLIYLSEQFPTRASEGPEATLADLIQAVVAGLRPLGATLDDVITVGLATPGPATLDGMLMTSPNLRADLWNHYPIRAQLEQRFQARAHAIRVAYIGDGQAAALGEFAVLAGALDTSTCEAIDLGSSFAHDAALRSLFFVAVGTGLGGGEVRDGKVVRGARGRAGHAGHLLLPQHAFRYEHDRQMRVGNTVAAAESAISLSALTRQLEHRLGLPQWQDHPLAQAAGPVKEKAKQLRQFAALDDPLALELLDDQARALGMVMLMVNYIGDYDRLVVGGGVCDMSPPLRARYLKIAEAAYHEHSLDGFRDYPGLAYSICGDQASVIGAMYSAYDSCLA